MQTVPLLLLPNIDKTTEGASASQTTKNASALDLE